MATHQALLEFVQRIAALPKDGESFDGSKNYDLTNDAAVDGYHTLIDEARALIESGTAALHVVMASSENGSDYFVTVASSQKQAFDNIGEIYGDLEGITFQPSSISEAYRGTALLADTSLAELH